MHINGNILTRHYINKNNFGTSGVKEINYLQTIAMQKSMNIGHHPESILVVGRC